MGVKSQASVLGCKWVLGVYLISEEVDKVAARGAALHHRVRHAVGMYVVRFMACGSGFRVKGLGFSV